ncbi:hypothetical protein T08_14844 [Trichinella sp. T8]|nr:hypothetical protein T08_14844 [Trichinella sp. T8]
MQTTSGEALWSGEKNSKDCGVSPFFRRCRLRFLSETIQAFGVIELETGGYLKAARNSKPYRLC